ncbi:MAG: DUF1127 domain-containing protein [Alphaproteobacteria bacterium]|nr:DUF1127 domain-containing protein [Alphaproteobacteria bacterium]
MTSISNWTVNLSHIVADRRASCAAPLVERLRHLLACHRERRRLADMPDWQLADLGLDRAAARAEAQRPFWRDLATLLRGG